MARLLACLIALASAEIAMPAIGVITKQNSNSCQEINAAPTKQAAIFNGSRTVLPSRLFTPMRN